MTKLLEWVTGLVVLFSVWFYLIISKDDLSIVKENYNLILYSPIIFAILFAIYAAFIVMYRVFTFNDCEEAADQLQKEIEEAKEELTRLGFKFKESVN